MSGAHYFFTIVDDFTSATWTFLVAEKKLIANSLVQYVKMIKNQFNICVKVIRCDNGTEFIGFETRKFFEDQGVLVQKSVAYTP